LTKGSTPDTLYSYYSSGRWLEGSTCVPGEMPLKLFVNGVELATILCTPTKLNYLVLGFLYSEGVIDGKDEVASMRVCEEDSLADVKLAREDFDPPQRRTLGSGCGGGVSFTREVLKRVDSDIVVAPDDVLLLVKRLNEHAELYREPMPAVLLWWPKTSGDTIRWTRSWASACTGTSRPEGVF
jgi:FdhD protein